MTPDILLARIAAVEAVARAATPGPWVVHDGSQWEASVRAISSGMTPGWRRIAQVSRLNDDAAHIALNDPARVLAVCAGAKTLVELHAEVKVGYEDLPGCCDSCDGAPDWPCASLAAVAAMFAEPGEES